MVVNEKRIISKYRKDKQAYHKKSVGIKRDYYAESMSALKAYLEENEKNPSESIWNHFAVENEYLSSKSIGFLSNINFNTLCRKLRKQINHEKRQKN